MNVYTNPQEKSTRKFNLNRQTVIIGVIAFLVAALGLMSFLYAKELRNDPQQQAQQLAQDLHKQVSKYLDVPKDELPSVAAISDVEKLKQDNPTFYRDAKNGDLVIIYSNKVILYNKDSKLVLTVANTNGTVGGAQTQK